MPLISSTTIITSISLFHLTLAFFFLTNPSTIDDQILVYILGESMGIPAVRGFDVPSPALALVAVMLAMLGLGDLVSLSMPEELSSLYYWGTQAPLRALLSMLLVFYTYFLGSLSRAARRAASTFPLSATGPNDSISPISAYRPSGWGGDAFKNRVFFTFVFLEMMAWFWVWVTLREERPTIIEKLQALRRAEYRAIIAEHND